MTEPQQPVDPDAPPLTRRQRREAERRAAREAERAPQRPDGGEAAAETSPAKVVAVATEERRSEPVKRADDADGPADDVSDGDDDGETSAPADVADGSLAEAPSVTSDPQPRAPKGGRNLPVAIGVGLGLGLLVVASLFFWRKEAFLGVATVACGVALWELSRAVKVTHIRLPLLPLLVGTVGMMISAYTAGVEALLVASVLTSGGAFIWRVLDGGGLPALRDATAAVFATCYVPFLAGFIALMLASDDGPWRVLTFIAVCVASDTGGYVAGVFFGKTRLAPIVSPKKSWEGLAGSYVASVAVGVGMMLGVLDGPWWGGLLLGIAGVTAAMLGDLAESLLKRDLGVKDMGNLLPGHGGMLDRIDSLLFAAPVAFGVFYMVLGN